MCKHPTPFCHKPSQDSQARMSGRARGAPAFLHSLFFFIGALAKTRELDYKSQHSRLANSVNSKNEGMPCSCSGKRASSSGKVNVEKTTIILFQRHLPDLTVQEGRLSLH